MHQPILIPRRAVLGAAGVAALVTITGCSGSTGEKHTVTVTAEPTTAPPPPPDSATLLSLVFTTRLHVQRLTDAVTAVDEEHQPIVAYVLADRTAHLEALEAEYGRVSAEALPSAGQAAPAEEGADPDEVLAAVRSDAATAQTMFTDALTTASRFQAQLYASIAAAVATHRMVLS